MKYPAVLACLIALLAFALDAPAEVIDAGPSDYRTKLATLQPGDILQLAAGDYDQRLTINGVHGTPEAWITIRGPADGAPARILGDPSQCCNTVEIRAGTYLALENLTIDGQDIVGIFAISASGQPTHHVRVENCRIVGHGGSQGTVAISTKTTTWGWVIRGNVVEGAGTGMYLGNSDGNLPFIGGLIEHNLFLDSLGYNAQIKHQNPRPDLPGIPTTPQRTIIRHNVFHKGPTANPASPRPNLLTGTFPETGPGSTDLYEIYGNLFLGNDGESLLQCTGRAAIHDNVFVDCPNNSSITLQDHNGPLKVAHVYNNTFYVTKRAIRFYDLPDEEHLVVGNVVFGEAAVVGGATEVYDTVFASVADAGLHVARPSVVPGEMDFYPLPGALEGSALDLSAFTGQTAFDLDFNGETKGGRTFRGAYAGTGANPGWALDLARKQLAAAGDAAPPTGSILLDGGAGTTDVLFVDIGCDATDEGDGMGPGALMQFSNDGSTWASAEPYAASRSDWPLASFGGDDRPGLKTVHARFRDVAGNWSIATITASIEYQVDGPRIDPDPLPVGGSGCSAVPGAPAPRGFVAPFVLAIVAIGLLRRRVAIRPV